MSIMSPSKNAVKVGKRSVTVDFHEDGSAITSLTTVKGTFTQASDGSPAGIVSAARQVVEDAARAEQVDIDRERAVADANRLLGN